MIWNESQNKLPKLIVVFNKYKTTRRAKCIVRIVEENPIAENLKMRLWKQIKLKYVRIAVVMIALYHWMMNATLDNRKKHNEI
jgi:hypothetical protein